MNFNPTRRPKAIAALLLDRLALYGASTTAHSAQLTQHGLPPKTLVSLALYGDGYSHSGVDSVHSLNRRMPLAATIVRLGEAFAR